MTPLLINSMPGTESPWVHVRDHREILFHGSGRFQVKQKIEIYEPILEELQVEEGHKHELLRATTRLKIIYLEGSNPVSVDIL